MEKKFNAVTIILIIFLIIRLIGNGFLLLFSYDYFVFVILISVIYFTALIGVILKNKLGSILTFIIGIIDLIFSFLISSIGALFGDLILIILAYKEYKQIPPKKSQFVQKKNQLSIPERSIEIGYCQNCGAIVKRGFSYCFKCGIKMDKTILVNNKEKVIDSFKHKEILPLISQKADITKKRINVFISYSTKDSYYYQIPEVAKQLETYPEIERVFFWEADSGIDIVHYMEQTLKICEVFILFCSKNAMKSKAVEGEWEAAYQLRKKNLVRIIPVFENEHFVPYLLTPFLNVKFNKSNFNNFINELYNKILRF